MIDDNKSLSDVGQGLVVVNHLFVLEQLLVLGLELEDSLYHLLEFVDCVVLFGVEEDGGLVPTNHEKHVHGG